jgi:hypothetical protein
MAANKSDLLDMVPSDLAALKEKERIRLQQLCENGAALFKQASAYATTISATLYKTSAKTGAGIVCSDYVVRTSNHTRVHMHPYIHTYIHSFIHSYAHAAYVCGCLMLLFWTRYVSTNRNRGNVRVAIAKASGQPP